jgi:hypothetical protein
MFEGQEAEEHRTRQAVEEDLRWSAVLVRQENQAIQSIASKEPAIVAKIGQDFPASLRTALSTTSEEVSVFTAASDLTGKAVAARKFCALLDKFQMEHQDPQQGPLSPP